MSHKYLLLVRAEAEAAAKTNPFDLVADFATLEASNKLLATILDPPEARKLLQKTRVIARVEDLNRLSPDTVGQRLSTDVLEEGDTVPEGWVVIHQRTDSAHGMSIAASANPRAPNPRA